MKKHTWKSSYSRLGSIKMSNYGFVECKVCKCVAQSHKREDLETECKENS